MHASGGLQHKAARGRDIGQLTLREAMSHLIDAHAYTYHVMALRRKLHLRLGEHRQVIGVIQARLRRIIEDLPAFKVIGRDLPEINDRLLIS